MKKKPNHATKKIIMPVLAGTILAGIVTVLGTAIATIMINKGVISFAAVSTVTFVILTVSSVAGNLLVGKIDKNGGIISISITTGLYLALLLSMKILFFDAPFGGIGKGMIAILLGAIPGVLISLRLFKGKKRKFKYVAK